MQNDLAGGAAHGEIAEVERGLPVPIGFQQLIQHLFQSCHAGQRYACAFKPVTQEIALTLP
jgi:hypothetical protein